MSAQQQPESPFKPGILKGKVALITGGGSGIGYEIARQLGRHGAKISIMGRREGPLKDAVSTLSAEGIDATFNTGDVRNFDDCKRVVDQTVAKYGRLDILVNNAAGNFLAVAEDLTPKGFKTVVEIDTFGVFHMCHASFEHLKKSGDALIINITATLHYGATFWQSHASAAKAAIDSLTRSYGLEWGDYGIRVVGIAPGPIADTAGMLKLSGGAAPDKHLLKAIPLRKLGRKWDIAMTSLFLASEAGSLITGETIVVDGGQYLIRMPGGNREVIKQVSRGIEKESRNTGLPEKSKM